MIKAICFDIDGLIIVGREKYFSYRLSEEKKIPIQEVEAFFINDFPDCSYGRSDLKEKIAPYLPKWNYEGSVEDLLQYWFESESKIDEEVLKIITDLRAKGIQCYLATRQEKYRMEYLLNKVGLSEYFDGVFCTSDIGFDKSEKAYWDLVLTRLNILPEEIMFFDDKEKNIEVAKNLGIQAYFYTGIDLLRNKTIAL